MTSSSLRFLLVILALALCQLAVACSPSQVDPGATVTIAGSLRDQSGGPVAGGKVVLAPRAEAPELLGGLLVTALSLGTVCLADPPPEPCASFLRDASVVDSGPDGSFAFSLAGSEVRTFFGNARSLGVSAGLPAPPDGVEGPAVLAMFKVQTEQLDLGPLRFWEPEFASSRGRAGWDPAPKDLGTGSGYRLEFTSDAGEPIWGVAAGTTRVEYDPRVLEDSGGRVSVTARRKGVAPGTTTDVLYRSVQLHFTGGGSAPPSRGKPCSIQNGNSAAVALPSCEATDGRLGAVVDFPAAPGVPDGAADPAAAEPRWVVVDMGGPINPSLVVVRGCGCAVEGSLDGSNWGSIATARTVEAAITPPRNTSVRFIRVGGQGQLSGLREVSIWP